MIGNNRIGKIDASLRRASALFELTDRTGGHHHSVLFRAGINLNQIVKLCSKNIYCNF